MKKFLVILMVVAMASFLFVGCLGVTPSVNTAPIITTTALPNATVGTAYTAAVAATDADGDALTFTLITGPTGMVISTAGSISGWTPTATGTESIKVAVTDGTDSVSAVFTITVVAADIGPIASTIPVVTSIGNISLYPTTTQYVKGGFTVTGYAPKYSEVQIYVDGAVVSTGYAWGVTEEFKISVSKTSLGVDGAKTLYATTTEVGLEESVPSTTYKFTLDTVAPEIVEVTGELEKPYADGYGTITVTFSEALDADTVYEFDEDDEDATDIDWAVSMWGHAHDILGIELISPKVVELETNFGTHGEDAIIRVTYEDADADEDDPTPITDLAGNSAVESVEYGYLELEGEPEVVEVTGVTLVPTTLVLTVGGGTGTLVATVAPTTATDTSVIWISSDTDVAMVIEGDVIPIAVGTANITVITVDGNFSDTCIVTVN